jgi:sugar phosphate isomerase/epimerase
MTSPSRFSLCQLAVPDTAFEEDVALCRELGIGLSLDTDKLGDPADDDRLIELMRDNGVPAAVCVAQPMTILPAAYVDGPVDVRERLEIVKAGIRRLARFGPATVFTITGPERSYGAREARRIVVDSLRELQEVAGEAGVVLSLEPMREENRAAWNLLASVAETVELIEEVLPMTERYGSLVTGVHVCDHREPTRSPMDRVLPGDGTIDMPAMVAALEKGGFTGWWDLEIFSDDGRDGNDFPDSIWKRPPGEWVREGKEKFDRIYGAAHTAAAT